MFVVTRRKASLIVIALALSGIVTAAATHDYSLQSLFITHPWMRAMPPGASVAGAYLEIENRGDAPDTLIAASSPAAKEVQLHTMTMDNGVMRMREIPAIDLPAKGKVALAPGGYHLMLMDIPQPLAEGSRVPLTLKFAKAGTVEVEIAVEAMGAKTGEKPMHGMSH
jgi:copper(I)-binding protein